MEQLTKRPSCRHATDFMKPNCTCNAQLDVTTEGIATACKTVARAFYGTQGAWLYDCYDSLNAQLFHGELPPCLIALELTAHGKCLGFTRHHDSFPRITIHPSLFQGREKISPWGIDPADLGWRYALDTLIHEMVHVSVGYRLGGSSGSTSHDCPKWRAEVERIAAAIGLPGFKASSNKPVRIKTGALNKHGRPETIVKRGAPGPLDYVTTYKFPHSTRRALGQSDYYQNGTLSLVLPAYP